MGIGAFKAIIKSQRDGSLGQWLAILQPSQQFADRYSFIAMLGEPRHLLIEKIGRDRDGRRLRANRMISQNGNR